MALGFTLGAWLGGLGPFEGVRAEPSAAQRTMRALPFDAPVPDGAPSSAGAGPDLPYMAQWALPESVPAAAAGLRSDVAARTGWSVTFERETSGATEMTLTRATSGGLMTHFVRATLIPHEAGSMLSFEFIAIADLGRR